MTEGSFPLEKIDSIRQNPERYRLLERVPLTFNEVYSALPIEIVPQAHAQNERVRSIVFLDTETTGINNLNDKIIELAMVKATFSLDRQILLSVDRIYDELEDPKMPIPEFVVKLTGISDDMVRGRALVETDVASFFQDNPLVVAHNAGFDRPFFESRFPMLCNLEWACSLKEITWEDFGSLTSKLEFLLGERGYFYDAHRASNDCLSLAYLMHIEPQAFAMLLNRAQAPLYNIAVTNAPFDKKDAFRHLGFHFNKEIKGWSFSSYDPNLIEKIITQLNKLYPFSPNDLTISTYSALERYRR